MKSIGKHIRPLSSWKSYLLNRFSDEKLFKVELTRQEGSPLENYTVTTKKGTSKTKIKFQLFTDPLTTLELMDIYFVNPRASSKKNSAQSILYKFRWQSFKYYDRDFTALEKWLDIPLYHGWMERSIFYKSQLLQTNAIWKKKQGLTEYLLSENLIKSYGLLQLILLPFNIMSDWIHSFGSLGFSTEEYTVPPMLVD